MQKGTKTVFFCRSKSQDIAHGDFFLCEDRNEARKMFSKLRSVPYFEVLCKKCFEMEVTNNESKHLGSWK